MNLEHAKTAIATALNAMAKAYGRAVFDEWAVVRLEPAVEVLYYSGPRAVKFQASLQDDLVHLREELSKAGDAPGEFAFSREADGSSFDAFVYLGAGTFLLCNNTTKSMKEVTADSLWLKAQTPFVSLSEKFLADPFQSTN